MILFYEISKGLAMIKVYKMSQFVNNPDCMRPISTRSIEPVINTGKDLMPGVRPGIFVPSGNWPL